MTGPFLRRWTDPRRFVRRLRSAWRRSRPFPLPQYLDGTPKVGGSERLDPHFPPTAHTLGAAATSDEATNSVVAILDRLTPIEELIAQQAFYRWGQAKYGQHWRFANILTALWAAATFTRPANYLEIGVRRGRSAAVVGATCPQSTIYGFDLWTPDYAGAPNPGPDFVRSELRAAGHTGSVTLISGDSRETLPAFLREHPDLYFDLITIDGDKSILVVASDFANALPRLKVGGIIVYDDLPRQPLLRRVWEKVIRQDGRYVSWEFANAGTGVATAIRVSDEAPLAPAQYS
jgi:predicted O-methyltransferase YrrM